MKKSVLLLSGLILSGALSLPAQDTLRKSKVLCFPAKNWGICFGNSAVFSGIRFNLADISVEKIDGLNVTFWANSRKNIDATVNGISAGLFPAAGTLNGINAGIMGVGVEAALNGLGACPGAIICSGEFNGVAVGSYVKTKKMNGLSIGVFNKCNDLHGIQIGLLNHAANNPKGLRWLPLINLHFGRK